MKCVKIYDWNKLRDNILCIKAPSKQTKVEKNKKQNKEKKQNILDMNAEKFSLGTKGHHYPHGIEWQKIWKMSQGHADEESAEKFHEDSTVVQNIFESAVYRY